MDALKLWIALNPEQLEGLNQGKDVFPDELFWSVWSSNRTCRCGYPSAILHGLDTRWIEGRIPPEGLRGSGAGVTALGYLQKVEGGILEKRNPKEYRWHGPLKQEEFDGQGRRLYRISEKAIQFI